MNKKLNKILRSLCILALWLVLITASYRAYSLYQYDRLHPQKEYTWSSFEGPPLEFTTKQEMMLATKTPILWGILIAIIWEVLLYFDDPKKHFITYLGKKFGPTFEKWDSKLEDDDEDENNN